MSYRELLPHPLLRCYVNRYWLGTPDVMREPLHILPDGCVDILFELGGVPRGRVVGTMTRAVVLEGRSSSVAAIRFRPGAAAVFLGLPAQELTDQAVPLGDLRLPWLQLHEDVAGAQALAQIEACLLARLRDIAPLDRHIAHAVLRLSGGHDAPRSVDSLCQDLGWSRQHLARRFRREVGVSPKTFARILRVQRAVERLQREPGRDLCRVALELHYFDQAHMNRDFREIGALTPARAREASGSIFPIPSLWLEA